MAHFALRWGDSAASDHRCDPTPAMYTAVMDLDVDGTSPRLRLRLAPRLRFHLLPRLRLRLSPPAPTRTRSESRCILPPLTQTNSRLPSQSPPARRGRAERAGVHGPYMCCSGLPVTLQSELVNDIKLKDNSLYDVAKENFVTNGTTGHKRPDKCMYIVCPLQGASASISQIIKSGM